MIKLLHGVIVGWALIAIILAIVSGKWTDGCWPLVVLLAHVELFLKAEP